ncbi:MAG TPA: tripartite tricarboxylate transporter substrate binding protein [Ramlibacter sp.]|jgi:tripartite-type tricarboxylate transporter receptor subunit TctC
MNTFARMPRRGFLTSLGAVALSAASFPRAWAAEFPDRPMRFIVPFGTGGNADSIGRLLATAMSPLLGQPIVVDNRAGAGGSLGAGVVASSAPDGLILLVGSNGPLTINPLVQSKLGYDAARDFAPVALAGSVPHVLIVNNDLPVRTLADLIALSRRQQLGCASSGIGSATHLTLERFNAKTGARVVHVPYRGGNSFVSDLLGGTLQLASMEFSTALPFHKGGKARIIAVAGPRRHSLAPEVPTFIESGVDGFTGQSFVGLLAPARTPPAVLKKLETTALAALNSPEMAERLATLGLQAASPAERTAAGFGEFLRADFENMREAVRVAGIKPE